MNEHTLQPLRHESVVHFYSADERKNFDLRISYIFQNGCAIGETVIEGKREAIELQSNAETYLHDGVWLYNHSRSGTNILVRFRSSQRDTKYFITYPEDR